MWVYSQSSGKLTRDGALIATGYSGSVDGKNDPAKQTVPNVGPIPRGSYTIGDPVLFTAVHGPFVMPLTPNLHTQMFGRSGFLIHGDSVVEPGTASQGCIILSRPVRDAIAKSGDRNLLVIT